MNRLALPVAVTLLAPTAALADLAFPPIGGVPVGPGLGFANFTNPLPPTFSNDDLPGFEQIAFVQIHKRFDAVATIDSPILVNFHSAGGATVGAAVEYTLNEMITNNTGQTWTSFEMELGENLLANFTAYTNANINVTFDVPNQNPVPVCTAFPIVTHLPHKLVFSGGSLAHGQTMNIRFQIDNLTPQDLNLDGTTDMNDIYAITLREIPMIPAPGTAALIGLGGLIALRRRR
ncbi:MAG: hypothetical protein HBSAPP03_13560 [Phycisphaerae bacterium]|nr:MAG: hypothetical protein HBSAPP03_13560 [Phycisphaerae bacterium]